MVKKRDDSSSTLKLPEPSPDFSREAQLHQQGFLKIAGVDEVGRGPLAGPVVVAAVILDSSAIPKGLDDSKRLTARRREALYGPIMEGALCVSVASLSASYIDTHNILQATLEGMRRAISGLVLTPDYALIDGRDVPLGLNCPGLAVVKGDQHSLSIAAASIIAKVTRDRMLERLGHQACAYGFEKHAGYGTAQHLRAIADTGPVQRIHRMSFSPLRQDSDA